MLKHKYIYIRSALSQEQFFGNKVINFYVLSTCRGQESMEQTTEQITFNTIIPIWASADINDNAMPSLMINCAGPKRKCCAAHN